MDYKEKVIALLNSQELTKEQKEKLENIFPELKEKESEDERIKKAIIRILKGETRYTSKEDTDKYVAWLEKQNKQSSSNIPSRETILAVWELGNDWKELTNGSISTEYGTQLEYIQKHWQESSYYDNIMESDGRRKR